MINTRESITDEQVMKEIHDLGKSGRMKEVNRKMREDPSIMRGILKAMEKNQDIARQAKRAAQSVQSKDSKGPLTNTLSEKKRNNIYGMQWIAEQKKARNYRVGDFDCVCIDQNGKLTAYILNSNAIESDVYTVTDIYGEMIEDYKFGFKYTVIDGSCFLIVFNNNPEIQRLTRTKNKNAMALANLNKNQDEHFTFKGCVWFMLLDENDNHIDISVEAFKNMCLEEFELDIFNKKACRGKR
jgi:hypothetical protein